MLARAMLAPLRLWAPAVCRIGVRSSHVSSVSTLPAHFVPPIMAQRPTVQIAPTKAASFTPIANQIDTEVWNEAGIEDNTLYMDSVLRKRRLKMKKHKLRKRRRAQRSLKKRLGKL